MTSIALKCAREFIHVTECMKSLREETGFLVQFPVLIEEAIYVYLTLHVMREISTKIFDHLSSKSETPKSNNE